MTDRHSYKILRLRETKDGRSPKQTDNIAKKKKKKKTNRRTKVHKTQHKITNNWTTRKPPTTDPMHSRNVRRCSFTCSPGCVFNVSTNPITSQTHIPEE